MLEEKKLGSIGGTAQTSGKEFIETLSAILFQVLVPARIAGMAMRNVHTPQLFLDFLTAHPDAWIQQTVAELHGHTKLPRLNQNQVVELSNKLYSVSPSYPMASSEQMEGRPYGEEKEH